MWSMPAAGYQDFCGMMDARFARALNLLCRFAMLRMAAILRDAMVRPVAVAVKRFVLSKLRPMVYLAFIVTVSLRPGLRYISPRVQAANPIAKPAFSSLEHSSLSLLKLIPHPHPNH